MRSASRTRPLRTTANRSRIESAHQIPCPRTHRSTAMTAFGLRLTKRTHPITNLPLTWSPASSSNRGQNQPTWFPATIAAARNGLRSTFRSSAQDTATRQQTTFSRCLKLRMATRHPHSHTLHRSPTTTSHRPHNPNHNNSRAAPPRLQAQLTKDQVLHIAALKFNLSLTHQIAHLLPPFARELPILDAIPFIQHHRVTSEDLVKLILSGWSMHPLNPSAGNTQLEQHADHDQPATQGQQDDDSDDSFHSVESDNDDDNSDKAKPAPPLALRRLTNFLQAPKLLSPKSRSLSESNSTGPATRGASAQAASAPGPRHTASAPGPRLTQRRTRAQDPTATPPSVGKRLSKLGKSFRRKTRNMKK